MPGLPFEMQPDIVAVRSFSVSVPFTPPIAAHHMKAIEHTSRPHRAVDEDHFVLPALMQPLLGRSDGLPVRVYRVTFGEGPDAHLHTKGGLGHGEEGDFSLVSQILIDP